jgi:hypothetical protein
MKDPAEANLNRFGKYSCWMLALRRSILFLDGSIIVSRWQNLAPMRLQVLNVDPQQVDAIGEETRVVVCPLVYGPSAARLISWRRTQGAGRRRLYGQNDAIDAAAPHMTCSTNYKNYVDE